VKIGILGTGDVGRTLGTGFVQLGHEVELGSRDAHNERARTWVGQAGSRATVGTFADAARFADMAVVAPWEPEPRARSSWPGQTLCWKGRHRRHEPA
jgi:predicted dinucleotide-binding enzyme